MNFAGRSFALSSAAASEHEIEYFDQHTGEAKKISKWIGKMAVVCSNEHPCRQGTLSCSLCGVRFKYDSGPTPGDTPACTYAGAAADRQWPSFEEAWDWRNVQEASDFYGVEPPPAPQRPSTAASSTEAWPDVPQHHARPRSEPNHPLVASWNSSPSSRCAMAGALQRRGHRAAASHHARSRRRRRAGGEETEVEALRNSISLILSPGCGTAAVVN